jgi:sugar phosphate isomerase/epimerase
MRLGVFTVLYQEQPLGDVLDHLADLGVQAVELGTGNFPGDTHCRPDELLSDPSARDRLLAGLRSRGMSISALSCHGNPLHPDEDIARQAHATWRKTVRLAVALEVPVVNTFSGCPGDGSSRLPNWVTCSWPPEFGELLEWQWTEKVIPYWSEEVSFARGEGLVQIALEPHPGFVVYNNETLLRLRQAVGREIGANFDPSHLLWQGADPIVAIRELGREDAIYHVHAKDTYLDRSNISRNGVLDTKHYSRVADRAWTFRTVGYGQGEQFWRDIVSALRTARYDYVLSIEHEDPLASRDEGLKKAVGLLHRILLRDKPTDIWWA